jgi:Ras-related protein Rab-1A
MKQKNIEIGGGGDGTPGQKVQIEVYDTAGQERYRTLTTKYFRDAVGVFIVFDVTNTDTFHKSLNRWVQHVERYGPAQICRILIGNKIDLADKRLIESDDANEYAAMQQMKYIETSAKDGTNVMSAFETLAKVIIDSNLDDIPVVDSLDLHGGGGSGGGCC